MCRQNRRNLAKMIAILLAIQCSFIGGKPINGQVTNTVGVSASIMESPSVKDNDEGRPWEKRQMTTTSAIKATLTTPLSTKAITSSTLNSTTTTTTTTTIITTTTRTQETVPTTTMVVVGNMVSQETTELNPVVENNSVKINPTVDSWSDTELLAHLIYAEAGNCTQIEMSWVGQVVLNRVDNNKFPNSIREVIFQKGQYAPASNGALYKQPSEICYAVAQSLMQGNKYIPTNVLFQTNGYLKYPLYGITQSGIRFYLA